MRRSTYHDLVGRRVLGAEGRVLGRVRDLEAEADGDELRVSGLLIGGSGFLRRLTTLAWEPKRVQWDAIASIDDDAIRLAR